jgi:hypothetical protein
MGFEFIEYDDDQRKTYSNAILSYQAYIQKKRKYDKSYRYRMGWQKSGKTEYLYSQS